MRAGDGAALELRKPPPTPMLPPAAYSITITAPMWLLEYVDEVLLLLLALWLAWMLYHPPVPRVRVPLEPEEEAILRRTDADASSAGAPTRPPSSDEVPCTDPATGQSLGVARALCCFRERVASDLEACGDACRALYRHATGADGGGAYRSALDEEDDD